MKLSGRGNPNVRFRALDFDGRKVTVGVGAVYLVVSG
jgi:hypothetical protein